MICYRCKKENDSDQDYCAFCGAALFGPQNISLSSNDAGKSNIDNIKNITGINLNDFKKVEEKSVPQENKLKSVLKSITEWFIKFWKYIVFGILLLLIILLIILYVTKGDKDSSCENNYDGYVNIGSFGYVLSAPIDFDYYVSDKMVLNSNNKKYQLIFYPLIEKRLSALNMETLNNYYTLLKVEYNIEDNKKIGNKAIVYIKYSVEGKYFTDFYYEIDGSHVLFGSIIGDSTNLLTKENKKIISSIKLDNDVNVNNNLKYFEFFN